VQVPNHLPWSRRGHLLSSQVMSPPLNQRKSRRASTWGNQRGLTSGCPRWKLTDENWQVGGWDRAGMHTSCFANRRLGKGPEHLPWKCRSRAWDSKTSCNTQLKAQWYHST
jgi:hypothetical protein